MSLEGKVAIVTGGGGGFGTEISKRLVAVGAKVVVVDIVGDNARRTADALGDAATSAVKPRAGNTVYATSKAAAIAFTKASALELAKQKIRVNTILPVASLTPMLTGMFEGDNSSRIEAMEVGIPLGRLGQPKDIAAGVMFFLSDEADFITGVALPVDGGWTAS